MQPVDDYQILISGQAHARYRRVGPGAGGVLITDQITDHYAPYCDEPGYSAINDIRVLAVCWRM